ncbi:MAG: magnesium transporter CorA [Deltaproteobacteria bacterium]|nr:magnesium transporter CorA [Deltaproteobacteria bacterium]
MVRTVLELPDSGFCWVDVVEPTPEELAALGERYALHSTSIQDCLEPKHQPKHERFGDISFIILRAFDTGAEPSADTIHRLTRKVAVFVGPKFVISVHRTELPWIRDLRLTWSEPEGRCGSPGFEIATELLRRSLLSYEEPLNDDFEALEACEGRLFAREDPPATVQELYLLKRRGSAFTRVLHLSRSAVSELTARSEEHAPFLQDLREAAERLSSEADQLLENATTLMNLHISLASHRTNEVMRVLTVFSVFFLPLTFIVGTYGMNFRFMPELEYRYGYPAALAGMVAVTGVIWMWARRKGWLG